MVSDFRLAFRAVRRAPGFAAAAVVTLALGIGANTGAFSALYSLLLKPLPYPEPDRLVSLYETTVDRKPRGVAMANLLDWQARGAPFDAMAVYQPRSFGLTRTDSDPVTVVQTGMVMAQFFRVVGVPPSLGRTFDESEEIAGARVMVLSDRLWRTMFAADPSIVGRQAMLNEEPHTIVGVMPPGFEYPMWNVVPDAYIPISRKDYCCGRLGAQDAVARLKPGVTLDRARSELESLAAGIAAEHPDTNRGRSAGLEPIAQAMTGSRRSPLLVLMASAVLLLLIALANVAGLMLARCLARSHEMAIRASLGAGLGRVTRQFLAEALVLSAAGTMVGLPAAEAVLGIVPRFVPGAGKTAPLQLDAAAFLGAAALALLVALLLAVGPILLLRSGSLASLIRTGGRQSAQGRPSMVRGGLVLAQVALSVVLLLSSGLLLRSFWRLLATSPGFQTAHAFAFGIGLPGKRYDTSLKEIAFHRGLLQHLSELPGVEAAGATLRLPLRGGTAGPGGSFQIWGAGIPMPQRPRAWVNGATPGYFAAMAIPLHQGRDFSWQDDRPGVHRVAIVNQAFVRAYLQDRRPIGTQLDVRWVSELNPLGVPWEIVGVVGDTRQANLDHEPIPEIFLSITQVGMDGGGYVIRGRGDGAGLPRAIAAAVVQQDPRIEKVRVRPLAEVVERNLEARQGAIRLVGGFGLLALLLTAVGVYGIVAFRASERSREMAIRVALGATAREVRALVLGYGLRVAAGGTAAGVVAFLALSPALKSQVFGVGVADPVTLASVTSAVALVGLAASLAPSRRASKAEVMDLLRED